MDLNYATFGLTGNPFPELARGSDVFVGPQAAKFIGQFRQALARDDAVVAVSGPAGSGKTTLVKKGLAAAGTRRKTVTVGGAPLQPDEVVEHLLIIFGLANVPDDRADRLRAWQEVKDELQAADIRLFVVIENALETGADVIAEFCALTDKGTGSGAGGSIVLMGDARLADLAASTELEAVRERLTLNISLAPFSESELRGYLRHAFRTAGGDFDALFDDDCVALLSQLSEGIPAAANSIVNRCLARAADRQLHTVSAKLLAEVGAAAYDTGQERFNFWQPAAAGPAARRQEPDLEALARAVAKAKGSAYTPAQTNGEQLPGTTPATASAASASDESSEEAIASGIDSAGQFGLDSNTVTATLTDNNGDLDEIARRLAEAKTIDDVDDAMGETLFGEEMALMAAAVQAKVAQKDASNDATAANVGRRRSTT